jgi:ADP-heptose:LPS heptosyltransferase
MRPDALSADGPRADAPPAHALDPSAPLSHPLVGADRILVVRLDNIGDVLLTGPLFRALRAAAPSAELTLLASPAGAVAAELLPWVDRVVTLRAVWQDVGGRVPFDPAREQAFIRSLADGRYDAALFLTSFSQTPYAPAFAAYLAGIPVRIGQALDFGGSVLSHPVRPPRDGTHQAERNLHLLDAIGVPVADRDLALVVPAAASARVAGWLAGEGVRPGEPIVVAPGASCPARRYDARRYGEAAATLSRQTGRPVVVAGTEREAELADEVAAACPGSTSWAGRTSLAELAALVAQAAVVLCGNSATLHLADALDRPVVSLYSGTDRESEWAPRRAPATLLRVPTSCHPCRRFECPYAMACLDIDPRRVATAALRLLSGREDRWVAFAS